LLVNHTQSGRYFVIATVEISPAVIYASASSYFTGPLASNITCIIIITYVQHIPLEESAGVSGTASVVATSSHRGSSTVVATGQP